MREHVVLPFVPVRAAMGTRAWVPGGKSAFHDRPPTSRGLPSDGAICMRRPGPALISQMPPPGLAIALGDIGGQEIHGADIEPDRPDRPFGHQLVVGMDRVRDIHRRAAR